MISLNSAGIKLSTNLFMYNYLVSLSIILYDIQMLYRLSSLVNALILKNMKYFI